jgi:enoyl-CoA hydratase/carnithine racemase
VSDEPGIDLDRRGSALLITIRNPARRNAFTAEMRRTLTAQLGESMTDPEVRAIVLCGHGEHFCSGADLSVNRAADWTLIQHRENSREMTRLTEVLVAGQKPVIAAVEGAAAGAGMGIACACDVLVVARGARFVPLFTRIGLIPELGLLSTLAQRVGVARARRILMASTTLDAAAALQLGLADELVETGHASERAVEIARQFEQCAPFAVAAVKQVYAQGIPSLADAGRNEADLIPVMARMDDMREGIAALREKRPPKFRGN